MATNFVQAIKDLHKKVASAQGGSGGTDPQSVALMIQASQQALLNAIRKNPQTITKRTGNGKQ